MSNPIPKDSQSAKLERLRSYINAGSHKTGLLGVRSHREIAEDCNVSTWFVARHLKASWPDLDRHMKRLRSR
ncbi:MAG: hypothetical protein V4563_15875 [Pseudomonadota bacterium]